MGEADKQKLGTQLDENERKFAEKVKEELEEHIEHRLHLKVYTDDTAKDGWIWGIARKWLAPWQPGSWIHSVFAYPDGKIHITHGWIEVTDLIEELHPKICDRLYKKTDYPEKAVEELFRVREELQNRENWKKYRHVFPKVIRFFKKSQKIAEEVSKDHNLKVEFWLNDRTTGIQAILDTAGMNEDQKLEAIMNAARALKDFDERLHPKR